jgi:hypothetical protein
MQNRSVVVPGVQRIRKEYPDADEQGYRNIYRVSHRPGKTLRRMKGKLIQLLLTVRPSQHMKS